MILSVNSIGTIVRSLREQRLQRFRWVTRRRQLIDTGTIIMSFVMLRTACMHRYRSRVHFRVPRAYHDIPRIRVKGERAIHDRHARIFR